MKIKKIVAAGAIAAVAITGALVSSAAYAEPVSGSYVLVGSDTLQDSTNALTNGTTITGAPVRVLAGGKAVGSFDAFGSPTIQTKSNGPFFVRPAGSGAGVTALRASISGASYGTGPAAKVITGQVDIARSSSAPTQNANGLLAYVPYARDAVGYVYKGGTAAWASLSKDQLKEIYDGAVTVVDGVTIKPRLPQVGSGTRNFFMGAIGYTGSNPIAPAVNDSGNVTPENDATVLAAGEIIPFSAASWIAQANGATNSDSTTSAGAAFGSPVAGTTAFTGTAPTLVANPTFYGNSTFGRDTYLVVERARIASGDAKFDATLNTLVTNLTSFGSLASSPGAVKKQFGFLAPSSTTILFAVPAPL